MDLNANNNLDPQLKVFDDYFDRMKREAAPETYKRMLQDVMDTCYNRLKAIEGDTPKKKKWLFW